MSRRVKASASSLSRLPSALFPALGLCASLLFYGTGPRPGQAQQSHLASRPLLFSLPLPECPPPTTGLLALCFPSLALRGLDILTSSLKWVCLRHLHQLLILLTCLCSFSMYRHHRTHRPIYPLVLLSIPFHKNADPSVACRKPESQAVEEACFICVPQGCLPIASNLGAAQQTRDIFTVEGDAHRIMRRSLKLLLVFTRSSL